MNPKRKQAVLQRVRRPDSALCQANLPCAGFNRVETRIGGAETRLMLVYGDPQFSVGLDAFAMQLAEFASRADDRDLDSARRVLIQSGQLEQGVWDMLGENGSSLLGDLTAKLTDAAAELFVLRYLGENDGAGVDRGLAAILDFLSRIERGAGAEVMRVKVPEGFEFYSLYPEQYVAATERWMQVHEGERGGKVLVVGLRSIGTTLSAVVRATLLVSGWRAERITVRPSGHPYSRQVRIPEGHGAKLGLVVDEGPGQSGSSMASTAEAMLRAGIVNLSFLPGHAGEPGAAASPETRCWWASTPRYVVGLEQMQWGGRGLRELLRSRSGGEEVHCLSAGKWRAYIDGSVRLGGGESAAGEASGEVPATPAFERTKYLSIAKGRGTLWKFQGLGAALPGMRTGAETGMERLGRLAGLGWTAAPVEVYHGFVAVPWIQGTRLTAADAARPEVLNRLAGYVVNAVGPPLGREEARDAFRRLNEMAWWNTQPAGDHRPPPAELPSWVELMAELPSSGDGRMAPYEWICTSGTLLKTDCAGHDCDHTLVGSQPVVWDIAGTIVEWNLSGGQIERILEHLEREGVVIPPEAMGFYVRAYHVFRSALRAMSQA